MKSICLLLLTSLVASAQQIVVKHNGQMADIALSSGRTSWTDIDVDGDGVLGVNTGRVATPLYCWGLLNVITSEQYPLCPEPDYLNLDSGTTRAGLSKCRDQFHAEYTALFGNDITVQDVATGEVLFQLESEGGFARLIVRDYDGDGLDDLFAFSPTASGSTPVCYDYIVLGTGSASLASPGATLDITTNGANALLTWQSVPGADGYRIQWAADPESPCFTQVGYTRESTFTHIGFADVPRGFYKVIAVTAGGHTGGIAGEGSR